MKTIISILLITIISMLLTIAIDYSLYKRYKVSITKCWNYLNSWRGNKIDKKMLIDLFRFKFNSSKLWTGQ